MIQFLFPRCEVQGYPQRIWLKSPKLKTGYRYENQFWNPGFTNGLTQFCRYRYFCFKILYYLVSSYFTIFFESLKSKSTQIIRPQKGTLIIWSISIYSLKYQGSTTVGCRANEIKNHSLWQYDSIPFGLWDDCTKSLPNHLVKLK